MPTDTTPRRRRARPVRVFPTRPGDVPVQPFAETLREQITAPGGPSRTLLEARSGVPARTIYRILNTVDRSVSFEVADALLTALDAIHLWHIPPLDAFFEPAPPRDQLLNPITLGQERARRAALARSTERTTAP